MTSKAKSKRSGDSYLAPFWKTLSERSQVKTYEDIPGSQVGACGDNLKSPDSHMHDPSWNQTLHSQLSFQITSLKQHIDYNLMSDPELNPPRGVIALFLTDPKNVQNNKFFIVFSCYI